MFAFYLAKVYSFLGKPLAQSEIETCKEFFSEGKSARYAAEYFK